MELKATVAYKIDEHGLSFVTFYDHEKTYGVSLTRYADQSDIEVMVADQSAYGVENPIAHLEKDCLKVNLPVGTIDEIDGEDEYIIRYSIPDDKYCDLVETFLAIFKNKTGFSYISCP